MKNKYFFLAMLPIIISIIGLTIFIEIQIFTLDIIMGLIVHFIIAWIVFFMYKAIKQDAKCDGGEKDEKNK